jgi:hypothetical protein
LYQQPAPSGRAAPPDTWRSTIEGMPTAHDECALCARRHSPLSLSCSKPAGNLHNRPFPQRWTSPPRTPLRPGGPAPPLTAADLIMPLPRRRARQQQAPRSNPATRLPTGGHPTRAPSRTLRIRPSFAEDGAGAAKALLERKPSRMQLSDSEREQDDDLPDFDAYQAHQVCQSPPDP